MFNSTKTTGNACISSPEHSILNDTANGFARSFLQPKLTSTPLYRRDSIYATPPKQNVLSSKRYSLSDVAVTPPRYLSRRDSKSLLYNDSGPLLGSSPYKVNVSTYVDTKSPGLAGRVVRYNEEKEQQQRIRSTHQTKYGSPGLFPVVHLFKKDLPVLRMKPKKVTVRIASPEYSRQNSQEYNRLLLEGIIKPVSSKSEGNDVSSTRSVLDALKEISRKRIHVNEDMDLSEETGKRPKTDNFTNNCNKRFRDESPLLDTSTSANQSSKRLCVYDEYAASCSSSTFSFSNKSSKRKLIHSSNESFKEPKQVKLITVETQTIVSEPADKIIPLEPIAPVVEPVTPVKQIEPVAEQKQTDEETEEVDSSNEESPTRIFTDMPLDRIRKNRLAALVGTLTDKDTVLETKPNPEEVSEATTTPSKSQSETSVVKNDEKEVAVAPLVSTSSSEKTLVSILSTPNKSFTKTLDKHVTFDIPESNTNSNSSSNELQTSVVPTFTFGNSTKTTTNETLVTPTPPTSPVMFDKQRSEEENKVELGTFALTKVSSVTSTVSSSSVKSGSSISDFFGSYTKAVASSSPSSTTLGTFSSSGSIQATTSDTTFNHLTSPKTGGFKFDLDKPSTELTKTVFVESSSPAKQSSVFTFTPKTSVSSTVLSDTRKTDYPIPNFGTSATNLINKKDEGVSAFAKSSNAATFKFGDGNEKLFSPKFPKEQTNLVKGESNVVETKTPTFSFSGSNKTGIFSFGSTTTASTTMTSNTTSSFAPFKTTTGVFDNAKVSVTYNPAFDGIFGQNSGVPYEVGSNVKETIRFGATTTTPPFGTPTTTPSFGVPTTSSIGTTTTNAFGAPTTISSITPSFGAPTTTAPSFGTPSFGAPTTTAPSFGAPTTTPPSFGASTTTAPSFGTPSFGAPTTTTPSFGAPTTTTPSFGAPTTTPSFGAPTETPSFGARTTTPSFGVPTTTPSFGVPTTVPSFGASSATNSFGGATKTPSFGSSVVTTPSFGAGVNASSFGSPATTTMSFTAPTTTTVSFGGGTSNNNNSSFRGASSSNLFGSTNKVSTFGGGTPNTSNSATNIFGATTNVPPKPLFGNSGNSMPLFGNTNATPTTTVSFGGGGSSSNTTPAFGTPNNIFESKTTATANSSVFGANNASSPPVFGSPSNTFSGNSGFGTAASNSFVNNTAPGNNTSFGSVFGSTSTNTSGFGGSGTFGGFTATSAFSKPAATNNFTTSNANPAFNFGGNAANSSGMFSFGAGATDAPKPGGFNFNSGAANSAFGGAPTSSSSFGGSNGAVPSFTATGTPQFNAAATPGTFSIGAGPPTGSRARPQIKAKRRT